MQLSTRHTQAQIDAMQLLNAGDDILRYHPETGEWGLVEVYRAGNVRFMTRDGHMVFRENPVFDGWYYYHETDKNAMDAYKAYRIVHGKKMDLVDEIYENLPDRLRHLTLEQLQAIKRVYTQ